MTVSALIVSPALCCFIVTIFLVLAGGCFMVLVDDRDHLSGMSPTIAALRNIGPGFGEVGPSESCA